MESRELKEYFDRALKLTESQVLDIPFENKGERESARVQLYRQRDAYEEGVGIYAFRIGVQSRTVSAAVALKLGAKYFVVLRKVKKISGAVVVEADGTRTPVDLGTSPEVKGAETETSSTANKFSIMGLSTAGQHRYNLMVEDGESEEDAYESCKDM